MRSNLESSAFRAVFSLIFFALEVQSANILGIFYMPGKSHYVMFERLLIGLAEKGHNVDVVTHFLHKGPVPATYKELSVIGSMPIFANNVSVDAFEGMSDTQLIHFITNDAGIIPAREALKTRVMQDLINSTKKYDLVITEIFGSDCMLAFGHHFKVPTVSLMSSVAFPWSNDRVGNPDNPSYIPTYFAHWTSRMSLWQRFRNTLDLLKYKFLYDYFATEPTNELIREFFGPGFPDIRELVRNTSLILVNSHSSMNSVRPTVPNFVEVGGLHIKEPKPLSKHFQDLLKLEPRYKGVIFLTMGSMILTETFPVPTIQGLMDAFAELPYRVLWKATREKFPESVRIPDNIHFESWMPQIDILCHPNVKLFVSHGGLMGSQEAVYCGVPRLGIPVFADQEGNIRSSEAMGLTIRVGYREITKENILDAARKLLDDPKYKRNAEMASQQFKDRPMSPLETSIFWVEYVIRHKGAPHLRSVGADLFWYQYHLLDIGFIFVAISVGIFYVLNLCLKLLFWSASGGALKRKSD